MILAVDAGNSRIKAMLVGEARVVPVLTLGTAEVKADPGEFGRRIEASRLRFRDFEGVSMCSVVPPLDRALSAALGRATGREVFSVRHTSVFPFRIDVADPRRLGADRLAAAAGAVNGRRTAVIIVDVGSAMTIDLVAGGAFKGGLIMAGPGLALRALGEHASRLPAIDVRRLGGSPAARFDDTRPSMIFGAQAAARGAVIEGVRVLRRASGAAASVVVTGGGADVLGPGLPRGWKRDPHLVAKGLYTLWELNFGGQKKA